MKNEDKRSNSGQRLPLSVVQSETPSMSVATNQKHDGAKAKNRIENESSRNGRKQVLKNKQLQYAKFGKKKEHHRYKKHLGYGYKAHALDVRATVQPTGSVQSLCLAK